MKNQHPSLDPTFRISKKVKMLENRHPSLDPKLRIFENNVNFLTVTPFPGKCYGKRCHMCCPIPLSPIPFSLLPIYS